MISCSLGGANGYLKENVGLLVKYEWFEKMFNCKYVSSWLSVIRFKCDRLKWITVIDMRHGMIKKKKRMLKQLLLKT